MIELQGVHLLLTYQCNFECDHCFVWGSPSQSGTMMLADVRHILAAARDTGTVKWIYFEGGEPFLYYPVMVKGVEAAAAMGFHVGVVTNSYWATAEEDAIEWLRPLAGRVEDLSVSSDLYHYDELMSRQARNARAAAEVLGVPSGVITIARTEEAASAEEAAAAEEAASADADADAGRGEHAVGQLPIGESAVMYQGRAAAVLAPDAPQYAWDTFDECPHENPRDPGRVHVDPLGHIHLCHGISLGNLFETPLAEICATYEPDAHPIAGPLLAGGPAELARRYGVAHEAAYADACHLCDATRRALRARFPEILTPDQMYGV